MMDHKPYRFLICISILFCLALPACKSKSPYNPYLTMKRKPSEQMARENKKHIKKGNRAYKKKEESSRKHLFGRKHAPTK
ncbi:MAG: hypothetical protein J0L87_10020 [Bacteroidetes bacterium]|nr:hypothetical protein [Bacteroidota bacterium]